MKSFTEAKQLLGSMAKVASTDTNNINLLVQFFNDSVKTICNIRGGKWWFLETTETRDTVASQQAYPIPANIRKLMSVTVTVGDTVYTPTPVYDKGAWEQIIASNLGESDVPVAYYKQGNEVLFAPTPATSANTITYRGRLNVKDLSIADYTTGTITTVTSGSTTILGTATSWTTAMAGRYLRITDADADDKGDGFWYKISEVTSATTLTLEAPYEGTDISAGAANYIIGQMTPLPEAYDMAPIYRALALYSAINDPLHPNVATNWWKLYDGGQEAGLTSVVAGLVGQMIENESETVEGHYISPNGIGNTNPNDPPQYPLTGF